MKVANKRIKLKHPVTYSRMVKVKAEDILREIHEIIAAVKGDLSCLSFTTDLWMLRFAPPPAVVSYINGHYVIGLSLIVTSIEYTFPQTCCGSFQFQW